MEDAGNETIINNDIIIKDVLEIVNSFPFSTFSSNNYSDKEVDTAIYIINHFLRLADKENEYNMIEKVWHNILQTTNFLQAPASTKYHQSCEHGLLMHSLGVMMMALKFRYVMFKSEADKANILLGDVVVSSLFHDLHKAGWINGPLYYSSSIKKSGADKGGTKYEINDKLIRLPDPTGSILGLFLAGLYNIKPSVSQAILCHDGQYVAINREIAHKEHLLTLIVHWADYSFYRIYESHVDFDVFDEWKIMSDDFVDDSNNIDEK